MWKRIKMAWDVLLGRAYAMPYIYQTRLYHGESSEPIKFSKPNNPKSWMES